MFLKKVLLYKNHLSDAQRSVYSYRSCHAKACASVLEMVLKSCALFHITLTSLSHSACTGSVNWSWESHNKLNCSSLGWCMDSHCHESTALVPISSTHPVCVCVWGFYVAFHTLEFRISPGWGGQDKNTCIWLCFRITTGNWRINRLESIWKR